MLFLTVLFYKTCFFPRQRLSPSSCITSGWDGGFCLFVFFFLFPPLLLSDLTLLKVNVACVPAESVL